MYATGSCHPTYTCWWQTISGAMDMDCSPPVTVEPEQPFLNGMCGTLGVLFGVMIFGSGSFGALLLVQW